MVNDERVYIHEDGNFFNAAWLTIRHIPGNTEITRPLIIAEGLDTGNFTAPEDFGGERTLQNFLGSINNSGDLLPLIDANNDANDYDIIYIDWVRGMGDMRDNSRVLEEVIGWINDQKALSNNTEPNVLLGQSMGGVIGRYTLARMENENKTHDVRLFVSHDSPMQGANTPLAFQHFATHMKEEYVSTPLAWATGEVLVPIGFGLAELGSGLLNFFGTNTSVPTFVTPSQLLSLQDQTASRQLNYWSAFSTVNGNHVQTQSYNQAWQQTLDTTGWPTQSRNIAISNGNECSVDNGFAPGAPLLVIDSQSNPGFLLDMLNGVLAPIVGAVTLDAGLIIVGAIPGRSRWQTNFDFNSYGLQGSQNKIYRGRIRYEKKVLWIGPTIKYDLTNRSYFAPQAALPFDTYSGGRFNFLDNQGNFTLDIPILADLVNVENDFYGFIPVVSALDIKKTNGNLPQPDDYLKSYSGGMPADTNLESGFDAFIVDNLPNQPFNNEHISFQVRNGNWLAEELEANQPGNTFPVLEDCSAFCTNGAEIFGEDYLCTTEIYSVTNEANPALTNWTVTDPNNLVSFTTNGNEITLTQNNTQNGTITLTAFYGNPRCGSITVTKEIWVGNPEQSYPDIYDVYDNMSVGDHSYAQIPLINGALQYKWQIVIENNDCTSYDPSTGLITPVPPGKSLPKFTNNNSINYTSQIPYANINWGNCTGSYQVRCYAQNSCGQSWIAQEFVKVYNPNDNQDDPCDNSWGLKTYPNPVKGGTIVVNKLPPGNPCDDIDPYGFKSAPINNEVRIYDFYGNIVYKSSFKSNEFNINGLKLRTGNYILNVQSSDGQVLIKLLLVE